MEDPKPKITFTLMKSKAKTVASHKNIPSLDVQDQSAQPPLQSTQVRDGSTHHPIEVISPNFNPSYEELGYDIWNSSEDEIIDTASSVEGNGSAKYHDLNPPDIIEGMLPSILAHHFEKLILFPEINHTVEFDIEMEDVVKPIRLELSTLWGYFQYHIAEMMKCHETQLKLGYKLTTDKKGAKPHSLETEEEYQGMQQDFLLEFQKQEANLKKKSKKTSQVPPTDQVPLKILVIDQWEKYEKKVCDILRDKGWH